MKKRREEYSPMLSCLERSPGRVVFQWLCLVLIFFACQVVSAQCPSEIEVLQPISCSGADDGILTVTVPEGEDPDEVYWLFENDTLFGMVQSGLGPGSYLAFVPGCSALGATLNEPFPFFITSAIVQSPTCDNPCSGIIEATPNFGTGSVTFGWSHDAAETGSTGSGICEGVVLISATDANGCQDQDLVVVDIPPVEALAFGTSPSCNGLEDGSVSAVASGGAEGGYSFEWTLADGTPVGSDANLFGLGAGLYFVTATDAGGCSMTANVVLDDPVPVNIDMSATSVGCFGDEDGTATVLFSEGEFYAWSGPNGFAESGPELAVILDLSPGVYSVLVTDSDGCIGEGSVEVEQPELLEGEPFSSPPTCPGLSNGTAGVLALGGTADYNVTWTLPAGETFSGDFLTGQPAGVYSFDLVDANGCAAMGVVTLVDPAPVTVDLTLTSPPCAAGELASTGSIEAVAEGGLGPYLAAWIDVSTSNLIGSELSIDNLSAGTYGLGVSDQLGCTVDTVVTLSAPDVLTLSVFAAPPSCFESADGQAIAVVEGGTADYTVLWTGDVEPTVGFNISNLSAGQYSASVSDELGCTATAGVVLVDPAPLEFSATTTPVGCSGADGTLSSSATGGVLDYEVQWTGPEGALGSGLEWTELVAGSYTGELTDANGCVAIANAEIALLPELLLESVDLEFDCATGTASLTASATGGDAPVILTLEGPSGTVNAANWITLTEGQYNLVATDQRGCTVDTAFAVSALLTIEVDVSPAGCGGAGEIEVTAAGGSGEVQFSELSLGPPTTTDGMTASWTGLTVGTFVVMAEDGLCAIETEAIVEGATLFSWTVETVDFGCATSPGGVSVMVEGGVAPVEYSGEGVTDPALWSTSDTVGLLPGQYLLAVEDAAGCARDTVVDIALVSPLSLLASATDILCFGGENGAIAVEATGGTGSLIVGAQGPQGLLSVPLDNLVVGDYTVGVVDARGCSADTVVSILEPTMILVEVSTEPESCDGTADGSAALVASGGTGELLTQWSGGPSTASWNGLSAGIYDWTVTDDQGCSSVGQAEVALSGGLTVTTEVEPGLCDGGVPTANVVLHLVGSATEAIVLLGGLPADVTDIAEGEGTWTWNGLPDGTYGWTASLGEGCGANGSADVDLPSPLAWVGTVIAPPCEADSGQVDGLSVGGALPVSALWSGVSVTGDTLFGEGASIPALPAGEYTMVLSDDAGCAVDTVLTIVPVSVGLGLTFDLLQPSCGGALVGEATLLPFGGVTPYEVNVEGAADSLYLPFLLPGNYPVTLTDSAGCTALDTLLIEPASEFLLFAQVDSATCADSEDGSVVLTTLNGTGSVDFTFSGPFGAVAVGDTVSGVGPGVYEVTALDESGCPAVLLVTVESPPALFVTLDSLVRPSCVGDTDGALFASASGGTGFSSGWEFNWFLDGQPTGQGPALDALGEGDYGVLVVDDAGCAGEVESIPLIAQGDVVLTVPSDTALCAGQILVLEAESEGATQSTWTLPDSSQGPGLTAPGVSVLEGAAQWVFTASRLGCVRMDTVEVSGLALPSPNAGLDQTIPEGGATTIGTEPNLDWSYSWTPSEEVLSPEFGATGTEGLFESTVFLLTALTSEGCSATDTVLIEVLKELDIPSGFTPNGDGFNDQWNLNGLSQYPSAQITLFNRWGEVLLTQGADEGSWDGTLGGIPVPVGTYYYHIRVDEPALQAEWTGPITLMR